MINSGLINKGVDVKQQNFLIQMSISSNKSFKTVALISQFDSEICPLLRMFNETCLDYGTNSCSMYYFVDRQ